MLRRRCDYLLVRSLWINLKQLRSLNYHFAWVVLRLWRKKTLLVIQTVMVWRRCLCNLWQRTCDVEIIKMFFSSRMFLRDFLRCVEFRFLWSPSLRVLLTETLMIVIKLLLVDFNSHTLFIAQLTEKFILGTWIKILRHCRVVSIIVDILYHAWLSLLVYIVEVLSVHRVVVGWIDRLMVWVVRILGIFWWGNSRLHPLGYW